MKKYILFLTAVFLSVNIFAYDRDYSAIQKQQEKEEGKKILFRDVFGNEFKTVINPKVPEPEVKKE